MHPYLDHDGPIAFAHRGGSLDGRENTMAAFARAVALGYCYVETDVHATADGELVAFHDATLDRVTDRRGAIADLPWREVAAARIAGTEPVPRLNDLLDAWPDLRVNVDVKAETAAEPLVAALRARPGVLDRVCVGSFSDARLHRVRAALGPGLCTPMGPREVLRLRLAAWGSLPAVAVGRAARCVQIPTRAGRIPLADPRFLATARRLGLPVHYWTVNDPARMRALLDAGAGGIVTDDVEALRDVLAERGAWRG